MPSHAVNSSLQHDKRVEALLKKEMVEHQAIISSHNKEMQALRDSLSLGKERFDSLFEHMNSQLNEKTDRLNQEISELRERIKLSEKTITDQKDTISCLHDELQSVYETHASKDHVKTLSKNLDESVLVSTQCSISSYQQYQTEVKVFLQKQTDELSDFVCQMSKKISDLDEKIDTKFSISSIDKEGISKEMKILDKKVFVIEKKLENIYTLIDRINKKIGG